MLVDDNEGKKASATSTQGEFPCLSMEPKSAQAWSAWNCELAKKQPRQNQPIHLFRNQSRGHGQRAAT